MSPHYPNFYSVARKWYASFFLLLLAHFSVLAQTSLYVENFTYANGTTQGSGNPPLWTLDNNGFSPATFSVQTNQFRFTNTGGEVIWQSQVFPINGWLSVTASIDLPASTNMEGTDYLRVYYKLNGGPEILFTTNGNNVGTYALRTASVGPLTGITLQLVVRASSNAANENHYLDNVTITGSNDIYYEPFNYTNNTIVSPLWTRNLNGCTVGTFSVQNNVMEVSNTTTTTCEVIWTSSLLDISSYLGVTARMDVSEPDGLEADDYIRIFYRLNGGAETPFTTNGSLVDDFTSAIASQSAVSGSTFQIVVRVKNNNGERHRWDNVTITADVSSGPLTASATGTNIVCNGASTGTVNLTVSGGRAPYTFSWSNGATTEDLSNVAAGTYMVTVTDNRGTTATASQTLTQPSAWNFIKILSNYNGVNVSCNGGSNGSIDLTVTGNTPPYTYLWSTGATTEDLSSRPAGTYMVTVTDASGCTGTNSTTLTQPAVLSTSETHVNVSCFGGSNGSIDLSAAGGTAPYSYSWSNGATMQDISGLASASYSVTVTDVNGCTATRSVSVTQPAAPLSGSIIAADTICNGQKITIDLTVSGGTAPYAYLWSTGATTQDLTNAGGGSYAVTVTDAQGCTITRNKTVFEPAAYSTSISGTNASQYGTADGEANLTVSGSIPPYTFFWSTAATTEDISNIMQGIYTVTITDKKGCTREDGVTIGYATPSDTIKAGSFIVNMGVSPQTFGNGLKPYGMVYDLVRNYKVPVIWSINPGKAKDAKDFTYNGTDYKGGTFIIKEDWITPAVAARIAYWQGLGVVGVYTTSSVIVPVFQTFTGFTNVVIDQQNEGIVIPYFNNAGIPTNYYKVGLPSDLNGCSDTYVLPHADPTWANHNYLRTFNNNKGYIWAGCHAVSVLEGIYDPMDVTKRMNFLSSNGLQCYGAGDCGALITEVHAGNPTLPFTYEPGFGDHPIMQFIGDMTPATTGGSEQWYIPLTSGRWNIGAPPAVTTADGTAPRKGAKLVFGRGFDMNENGLVMYEGGHSLDRGAVAAQTAAQRAFFNFIFLSSVDKALKITHNIPKTFVKSQPQSVSVTASKGTPPYSYQWTATCGGTFSAPNAATTDFTVSHLYTSDKCYLICEVTDACGRFNFVKVRINIIQPNGVKSNYNGVNVSCFGSNNGSIDLTTSGGTPPYTWLWSTGATTEDVSGLTAGSYYVTITDADNYVSVDTFVLTQPAAIALSFTPMNVTCFGGANGSVDLTPSGGVTPYAYAWSSGSTSQDISSLPAGTYSVTVTDLNGCTKSGSVTVTQPAQLTASLSISHVSGCFGGNDGAINLTAGGGTPPYTYDWADIAGTNNTEDRTSLVAGTYTVTVTDSRGCTVSASGTVIQPAPLTTSETHVNAACYGTSTGSIDLTPAGGTPPYAYSWSNGAATQDLNGVAAGTYTVTVTDARGCIATRSIAIIQPPALAASETHINVSCHGGSNGSIDLTVSGGTMPCSYNWSSGQSTQDISGLTANTYTVTATDANGCSATLSVTITQPAVLSASVAPQHVSCNGGSNGSIDLTAAGGTSPFAFLWSTGATTEDISALAAGSYSVTVTDANGCTVAATTTILQPDSLTASATQVNVSCYGGSNGFIDLTPAGGTTPYAYNWSNGAATQDASGLAAATYWVTVTDARGCTTTLSRIISQPAILTTTSTQVNVSCKNGSNGSVDLTVAGGTPAYSYLWSNGSTTQDISGLAAGTYNVTVTDALGCIATSGTVITEPPVLSSSLTKTDVSCYGGSNGSVDLTISGGTTPYSYAWSSGAATEDISGLPAGTYNVSVTDANGCTITTGTVISQPDGLSASATQVNVSCNGGSNGSVNLTVSGGTAPYSYTWSNSATTQNISALSAGTYTVTITDANHCTISASATVTQPPVLMASAAKVNVSCFGGSNGFIDLTVNGGTPAYSYIWSNGAITQDISGLAAGTYSVTVTDTKGCTVTRSTVISQPAVLTASATKVDVSCNGGSNGSIDLTISGGTAPYSYIWSNDQTTEDISGLSIGTFNVTVTDAQGCTASTNAAITEPPLLTASATMVNVLCNGGNNGSIDLTVTGGTSPYSYLWSNNAATQDINGLTAGTYSVTISDFKGCSITQSVTITEPALIAISWTTVNASCNGGSDGGIDLTVTGGVVPFAFSWSNGAAAEDLSGIPANLYSVTVTDDRACTMSASIPVGEATALTITLNSVTNVSCHGGNNGSIDISATGGTMPFTYAWSNGATSQDVSALAAGAYSVTITDANICKKIASYSVTQPAVLSAAATPANVSCSGGNNGSINLTVAGGTAPYAYNWSNGSITEDISALTAGTYTVTVTDTKGCTVTASTSVTQPPPLTASLTQVNVSCNGGSDGAVNLTASGGTSPYSYSWSNGATSEDLASLPAGMYSVTVTDVKGCTAAAGATITEPALLTASATQVNVSCNGGSNGSIDLTVSGGTTPYNYSWSNGSAMQDISGLTAGTYHVTVTDAKGCSVATSAVITEPLLLVASYIQANVSCKGGSNGSIDLTVTGGIQPYSYAWTNGSVTQDISGLTVGTYSVTITDAKGCSATSSATITEPPLLTASTAKTDVSCRGGSNGSIDLTVSGGIAPYGYSWSNGAATEDVSGLIIGTYIVTVTDANGCTVSSGKTITEPAALAASFAMVPVSCYGSSDGSINLSVSGGTAPYSFAWTTGATTEDLSGLISGIYGVTITDAQNCVKSSVAVVTEASALSIALTGKTDVNCKSGSDGALDISVSGGTPPYAYLWNNGAATQDISGLTAGNYSVTVTDANNCTKNATYAIAEPPLLTASSLLTHVTCNGFSNGAADLTVNGGVTPYTYIWSNGTTTQDISLVAAGTYGVTVTDAHNCTVALSNVINEPALLIITETHADLLCNGANTGSINITVSGGITSYQYNWSNGSTSEDLNALIAGSYTVTVTDANACSAVKTITLTQPSAISITPSAAPAMCDVANGTAKVSVSGGTPGYAFVWSTGATADSIGGLSGGNYGITVTDMNSCIKSMTIAVNSYPSADFNLSKTDVTCHGGNDGVAAAHVTSGTPPYTFLWMPTGGTDTIITSLTAGTYSFTILDSVGCNNSKSITLTEPPAFSITMSLVDVSCHGANDGSIDLNVSGSTPPYTYIWSNGATTQDIDSLTVGSYDVTITDVNGCAISAGANVTQPNALASTVTVTDVNCHGANDGSINLTVSGGTAPYSFAWSNGVTTEDVSGLTAATYTVTVTDAQGCIQSKSAAVNEPPLLDLTFVKENVKCKGNADGSVNITVNGGTSPYSFLWSTGAAAEDVSGLPAGNYTVTVTDNHHCIITQNVSVTEPDLLTASSVVTDARCNGGMDGSIDLTVNGGTVPYAYLWSNGAAVQDISNLSAAYYTVTVTDANGCTLTYGTAIEQPAALSFFIAKVDVSCHGGSNGSVDLTVSGGTAPYDYSWSNGASTQNITGLPIGNYTVTVTDANGCMLNSVVVIAQPPTLAAAVTSVDVSCKGGSDGRIDLAVTGGTFPYSFNWSNGAATEDVSGLATGTYSVTVTDTLGCVSSASATITEPALLTAATTKIDVRCFGGSDGSLNLAVSGGTAPYFYSWSNGAATKDITGLPAGFYAVTVTDSKGCVAITNETVGEPPALGVSLMKTDASCNGAADASIDLTVTGGMPAYGYSWSNGATTQDLSGLAIGAYSVTVSDSKGCSITSGANITEPDPLAFSITKMDVSCHGGSNGSVDLTIMGGTAPYSYNWSTGAATQDIGSLTDGIYTVTVTDTKGCTVVAGAAVTEPAVLAGIIAKSDVSCHGGMDGSIDLTVSGGTLPYTFAWTNGKTAEDIDGLAASTYSVTITDAKSCTAAASAVISEPSALAATYVKTDVSCDGGSNGSINITASGGTPPYSFRWSNGASTEDLNGITKGNYTVTVTDAQGCTLTQSVSVGAPDALAATFTVTNATCSGSKNGAVDATVTGGTPPYSYLWNFGVATQDISNIGASTYSLTVTDAQNCQKGFSVTVGEPQPLVITPASITHVSCNGGNNGVIDISVSGGTLPYAYTWSTGSATEDASGLTAGNKSVTVTDAAGCTKTRTFSITQPAMISITTASVTAVSCNGGRDGAINITVTGGTPAYTFIWSSGAVTEDVSALAAGSYTVTVADANTCTATKTITVSEPSPIMLSFAVTHLSCHGSNNGSIDLTVSGGTPGYSFAWSAGAATEDISGLSAGIYSVTVSDANNCHAVNGANVNQPSQIAVSITKTDVKCHGASTGSIDATASGGTPPYRHAWSNGATTEDISGLPSGAYSLTITDLNNCKVTTSTFIGQPAPLNVALIQQNVLCNGGSTGFINITVSGGVSPYNYIWSNGMTTEDLNGIAIGSYTVTATDANGCMTTKNTVISEPPPLTVSGSTISALCNGSPTGSINITAGGGTAPFTYSWSTGALTEDISAVSAGNYTVTVSDAHACSDIKNFTVGEPSPLVITVTSIKDVTCNGRTNGAIAISASGGTSPYTYLWNNGATATSLSSLPIGTYTVTVTDANGCVRIGNYNIGQPPPIAINATAITNTACHGAINGAITLSVSGGTSPYTFLWNHGATTKDISGIAAASYTVTVTDAQGCKNVGTFSVGQPPVLTVTIVSFIDARCHGANNGIINISVSGGTPPYSFLWSTGAVTEDVNNLTAGSYTVTVTDANHCVKTATHIISQPAVLNVSASSVSNALCYGQPSGSVDITVNGGTAPYSFLWSNGAATEDLVGVTAGNYTVTVTDAQLCSRTATYSIGQPAAVMTIGVTGISDVRCFGAATGYINIMVGGGTAPYTYQWSNGAATKDVSALVAGSYQVTVTDANGCKKVGNFNIGQPAAITVSIAAIADAICYGRNLGSVDVSISGGTPPYTYSWSTGAVTQDIRSVPSGNYNLTVTDGYACSQTATFAVGQRPDITVTAVNISHVSCYGGSNGRVDIEVSGGTAPYSYDWSSGAATEDAAGLYAGAHTVTVTDSAGCVKQSSFNLTEPSPITIAATKIIDAACHGQPSGSIDITVHGGIPPYLFSWSSGINTEDAAGLPAGSYTVTAADAAGCLNDATFRIGSPAAIGVSAATIIDVKCHGDSTGVIEAAATGGNSPYTFQWSNGVTAKIISGIASGTYAVTASDVNGCIGIDSFKVNQPDDIGIQISSVTNVKCKGGTDGAATITVSGGTPPYLYKWSNGMSASDLTGVRAGDYVITVSDVNNCEAQSAVTVGEGTSLMITAASVKGARCYGEANGEINITVSGGTAPYTYLWSNEAETEDIRDLHAGVYTVTATDANGCKGEQPITVMQPGHIIADSSRVVKSSCAERNDGRIELFIIGGTAPFTYRWSTGETKQILDSLTAGTYLVTITDANGCTGSAAFVMDAPPCNLPPIAVNDTASVTTGNSTDIFVMDNDHDPDNDNLNVSAIIHPPGHGTATINSDGTITYTPYEGFIGEDAFTYVICDDGFPQLCDTAIVFIRIKPDKPDLFIPNAISPNNDESNEYWHIRGIELFPYNEVVIFNRWGNEVYRMNSYSNQWNGINHDKEPLPDGTYYYILKLNDKYKSTYTGYVIIFRG